ncbi:hypothetical protein [Jannaschia sp. R86511]|uniref:hypothetical protein n=1 Tax=Jannaschia sp. R86511 TaxID=3093853 RepID=UPI0036D21F8A
MSEIVDGLASMQIEVTDDVVAVFSAINGVDVSAGGRRSDMEVARDLVPVDLETALAVPYGLYWGDSNREVEVPFVRLMSTNGWGSIGVTVDADAPPNPVYFASHSGEIVSQLSESVEAMLLTWLDQVHAGADVGWLNLPR